MIFPSPNIPLQVATAGAALMDMFVELIDRELEELHAERVVMSFIGRRDALSAELRAQIDRAESHTKNNAGMRFVVAMNYGDATAFSLSRRAHRLMRIA